MLTEKAKKVSKPKAKSRSKMAPKETPVAAVYASLKAKQTSPERGSRRKAVDGKRSLRKRQKVEAIEL